MTDRNSGNKNNKPVRKTVRKKSSSSGRRKRKQRKPLVKLSKEKVLLFCSVIFLLCALCLSLTILFTPESSGNADSGMSAVQTQEKSDKRQESQSLRNNSAPEKKENTEKKAVTSSADSESEPVSGAVRKKSSEPVVKETSDSKSSASADKSGRPENKSPDAVKEIEGKSAYVPDVPEKTGNIEKGGKTEKSVTEEKKTPAVKSSPFDIPQAVNGATIVIVIDDAGRSASNTRKYAELPFPVSIAVLPSLPQTKACARIVVEAGQELLLHQPMQAENLNLDPGPGAITADMPVSEIGSVVRRNLDELGAGVKGLNNHEGSLITANVIKIGAVLDVCSERGIYFLDSRTTAATKAPQAALERDMHIFEKSGPYIDNVIDRNEMLRQMYASLDVANKKGRAIIIGHVDKSVEILPDLLEEMYPYLVEKGYNFAVPSQLR